VNTNDLLNSMVKEALEEVANRGWKDASNNAVTLVTYGLISQKITNKIDLIMKPAWIIALSIAGSAIFLIIRSIWGF